jgi:2-polyprenyl-6-methoxyphenol hydroxylase-like FAD-dependent oxidoreductase
MRHFSRYFFYFFQIGEISMASLSPDVVIIGGGIGGGTMATVLARSGLEAVVLERETTYPDRVRGEWIAPWGVVELQRLGLLELLHANGALHVQRNIPYDENWSADVAEGRALDFTKLPLDVAGPLCIGHPLMCNLFAASAVSAGAKVLKGVSEIEVTAGASPVVAFSSNDASVELKPRLVIGADGRNSIVRKQLGFEVLADEPHNLLGGMLVSNVPDFPRDIQVIGTEDRFHFLVFPQGQHMVRLYACYDFADRKRFSGPSREALLLQAFGLNCLPYAEPILAGTPISSFNSYSNEDHWVDDPTVDGVVLIGDAAGHNDPVTGQGVSITARDVRIVSDILLTGKNWTKGDFVPYVEERAERMRRLRIAGRLATQIRVEFGSDAKARRARVSNRMLERQLSPLVATLIGPDRLPPEAFLPETIARLVTA